MKPVTQLIIHNLRVLDEWVNVVYIENDVFDEICEHLFFPSPLECLRDEFQVKRDESM